MIVLRLFHSDRPFEQIESRRLAEGSLTFGRDPSADWCCAIDSTLSRLHCTLSVAGGQVSVCDTSTNGVFLETGERAPKNLPVPIGMRQSVRLGAMMILVDQEPAGRARGSLASAIPVSPEPKALPDQWSDPAAPPQAHRDASLIEAFCEGARLDPSALSGIEPAELMRCVGEIYQQTILGLGALMTERAKLKQAYQVERTTIRASQNNPFKWTPSRRLAEDLLCKRDSGFLSDAEAVRASFNDLSQHLAGVAQGANSAIQAVMDALDPRQIEAEAKRQGGLLSGASTCWKIHQRRYEGLSGGASDDQGAIGRAFGEGYVRVERAHAGA